MSETVNGTERKSEATGMENGMEKPADTGGFQKISLEQFMAMSEDERATLSLSQRKKLLKLEKKAQLGSKKEAEAKARAEAEMEARLAKAREVKIEQDMSLPTATGVKIKDLGSHVGERVKIFGWVMHLRQDGKKLWFIDLRDGTGFAQVVLTGKLCQTYDAVTLCREASIAVYGRWVQDENGRAQGTFKGHELQCDYWELIGASPSDIEMRFTKDSSVDILLNARHLVLRGSKASSVMKMRSVVTQCFREHLFAEDYTELMPPTLVNTQCEGGSTLFQFSYFEEENAYLTQSSQLYLETGIPAVGDCFCILPSYRAEKSSTRRHLAEYHHLEAERPFITFEQLLDSIEHLVVDTVDRVIEKTKNMQDTLMRATEGKPIKKLEKPFKRMTHSEAVDYCRAHDIYKDAETKEHFTYEDDIPEGPERQMTDQIGVPIMLIKFPATLKSFYMQKCDDDRRLTESVDVLLPGVGEVVGGSMRMWNAEELDEAYNKAGVDPAKYGWYTDQRRYGTCPHGGYGLGIERFLTYILGIHHIRDVCMYPRYRGRISP